MKTCSHCQHSISRDMAFCPQCGAVFERSKIHHTPIDHRVQFFSRRYLRFLFLTHRGRLNRERYITAHFFILSCFLLYFIAVTIVAVMVGHTLQSVMSGFKVLWILLSIGIVMSLLLTIPLKIKRAHDLNYSAHWCWLWAIPGVSVFAEIWFWVRQGTAGANHHGLCPRGKNRYTGEN